MEILHGDPEFQSKKTEYFQDFILKHIRQARIYKDFGLLNKEGSREYRNVVRHQLLSGVMTHTIGELLGLPEDQIEFLTNLSLIHDSDKRIRFENDSVEKILNDELTGKTGPLRAVGTNFTDFGNWGIEEYILRYVDSSVGENSSAKNFGQWHGPRNPNELPAVIIVPWRERLEGFKKFKEKEGEMGVPLYGTTTWEKLDSIMIKIEKTLFELIIKNNPELGKIYSSQEQLTELIENKIHEKILRS